MPIHVATTTLLSPRRLLIAQGAAAIARVRGQQGSRATWSVRSFASALPNSHTDVTNASFEDIRNDVKSVSDACVSLSRLNPFAFNMSKALDASNRLAQRPPGHVRISVFSDAGHGHSLVSAILDDPTTSDPTLRPSILGRWMTTLRSDNNVITFGHSQVKSPFFTRFEDRGIRVEISEVGKCMNHTHTVAYSASADIPIVVVSATNLLQTVAFRWEEVSAIMLHNPNSLLIVDGPLSPDAPSLEQLREDIAENTSIDTTRILVCDSTRALRGSAALASEGTTVAGVRLFQDDVSASNVPLITERIVHAIEKGPEVLRNEAVRALVKSTVAFGGRAIREGRSGVERLRSDRELVIEQMLDEREQTIAAILGVKGDTAASRQKGRVTLGIERVSQEVKPVVDGLSWTKLPFVVDDISTIVDGAVERSLTRQFGNELMFQTGRLASLQENVRERMDLDVSSAAGYPTSVVENRIDQIISSPSYTTTSTSHLPSLSPDETALTPPPALLAPLQRRTMQLSHATRALHLSAQRALLVSFTSAAASFSSGASLCVFDVLDVSSGFAAGALGSLLGLRWSVGLWTNAKERWWSAFGRVGEGLERDLRNAVETVLDEQVYIVPRVECEEMEKRAEKVEAEIVQADELVKEMEAKYGMEREVERQHNLLPIGWSKYEDDSGLFAQ